MRLSKQEINCIIESVSHVLGIKAKVWLFGSRCDDKAKGGDIDLYIELPPMENVFMKKIKLRLLLEDGLGEQKIDLVCRQTNQPLSPFHEQAKTRGILLK